MSGSKKYYWKKSLPQNPVTIDGGRKIQFEDLGAATGAFRLGYAIVEEDVHKELGKATGVSGLKEGTKSEYDEIKKKLLSEPLEKQWREEIAAPPMSPLHPQPTKSAAVDKEPAQKVIDVQSETEPLPEDSKPKVGKRKATKEKDEA